MNRNDVYASLNEVFRNVFDDETITVQDTTTAADIEDWDSLEHINLMVAIEKKFGLKFTMNDIARFQNVGEMVDLIIDRSK